VSDFPSEILQRTEHRPWSLPTAPWIMTQSWHDLLFAHWPVAVRALREHVPPGVDLDLFDGEAWLGVVPFRMTNVAPRGVPNIPFVSAFNELNVRTYVTHGGKPGVFFFSLDADSQLAVTTARTLFGLPYYAAEMKCEAEGEGVRYASRRTSGDAPAVFGGAYRPVGPVEEPRPGTLEYFLTERYCLYTVDDRHTARRLEIHHPRWPLQPAEAEIAANTMPQAAGLRPAAVAPLLHFSRRQDVVAWPLTPVGER
jgi:uncharacterized protein